jgi:galactan 5-O-arabinofuranosyltransferase
MTPVQLVLAAGVPLLAYAFWRRVIAPWPAACVVLATTMLTVHLQKPDEWLVLAVLLPWWLEVVRGIRNPAAAEWSFWRHGLVLGVLLLTHTYYFLPLAVATALALAADLLVARQLALPVKQALLIAGTGFAVSAPYWLGMLIHRVSGAASDTLQLRYSFEGANRPPEPPNIAVAALWGVGLAWLVFAAWSWRRNGRVNRLAAGLALALAGSYLTLLAGAVAMRFDVGLLAFKTAHLIIAVQVVCGVLGLGAILTWVLRQPTRRLVSQLAVTGVAAVLSVSLVSYYTSEWIVSEQALRAQTTRYPDGTWPEGASLAPSWLPARLAPGDPSVEQVLEAWDRVSRGLPRSETVLVTTRVDLLATTPVYAFVPLKSIYSHPNARFEERLALLQQVARCPDSHCAADFLRTNEFDSVDGLILERDGRFLSLAVYVDNFPDKTRLSPVRFPARLFEAPYFKRRDVGRWAVISLLPAPAVEVIAGH